jgi:hypothetical protein
MHINQISPIEQRFTISRAALDEPQNLRKAVLKTT